jgi:type IV pilus assembly protein PilF
MALAGVICLGVGIHWVNEILTKRRARALLEEAHRLEADGRLQEAAPRLNSYLRLVPEDTDALAFYASLLGRLAKSRSERTTAFFVLEQVLRRDGGRQGARRQAAEAALEIGRFSDAKWHLEALLRKGPGDPEVMYLLGRCEAGNLQPEKAARWYAEAVERAPDRVDVWQEYAALLRERLQQPRAADEAVARMVRANDRSPAARYLRDTAQADRAEEHVLFALEELRAEDPEVLPLAADLAVEKGDPGKARRYLELGLARYPGDRRLGLELARLDLQDGHRPEARRHLEPGLERLPEQADALWHLGNLLIDASAPERAGAIIERLLEGGAAAAADCLRAQALMQQEDWAGARNVLEHVRLLRPLPQVLDKLTIYLLAECYDRLDNPDQQLSAFQRALESDPNWLPARRGAAGALVAVGKLGQAIAEYRHLLPDLPEARPQLVRLLVARNLKLPPGRRPWGEVEHLLKELPAGGLPETEVRLLGAEVLVAKDLPDEAHRLAAQERDRDPSQVGPWLFLIGLAEQQGPPDTVLPLIAEAERRGGRRAEWQLARARHWANRGGRRRDTSSAAWRLSWESTRRPTRTACWRASPGRTPRRRT